MSSQLLSRTSQRLKQLLASPSTSKKSTNQDDLTPTLSPATVQASPLTPATSRRTSRPQSWISHTSSRKCEVSHIEAAASISLQEERTEKEGRAPRIEPPAIPNTGGNGKGRRKSAENTSAVGISSLLRPNTEDGHGQNIGDGHVNGNSRSGSSLCDMPHLNRCEDGRNCILDAFPHGDDKGNASVFSLSGLTSTPSSCFDTTCNLCTPQKDSRRRNRNVAVNDHDSYIQGRGSTELFQSPVSTTTTILGTLPSHPADGNPQCASSDRWEKDNANHASTLDLLEALQLNPQQADPLEEADHTTATGEVHRLSIEDHDTETEDRDLPLTRTAWSDDVDQLIRETDKAFKAVGFALSDAKSATGVEGSFRAINWRPNIDHTYQNESGSVCPKKSASMRMKEKQAAKTPLTRNASIKASKQKARKGGRKVALQAFPTTMQNPSPRWTLPEVTAELFGGRMFGKLEADEMLKSEESMQRARWTRECKMSEREREERQRDSSYSTTSVETKEEDRSTPVEPFHLEELSSRLSNIKLPDGEFETPRPPPKPPVQFKGAKRISERFSDFELSQPLNTVLPPIQIHSPISPPRPGTFAVFNATAPLSPLSAISPPLNSFHENGLTDQDPLRFGKMKFPSPPIAPIPSQPQPIPRRASRSRSVTRTNLATIRETSPADPEVITHSQSMPATPAKNRSPIRSPIRSPPSRGTPVGITPPSPESPHSNLINAAGKSTTLLQSAMHNRGNQRRPDTRDAVATTEAISSSLSPRKVTPFPSQPTPQSLNAGLVSTPFSLTAPMFRHGSIRLNEPKHSQSFPSSGMTTPKYNYDGEGGDGLKPQVIPLDWTAFQMAISGGVGEYHMPGFEGQGLDRENDSKKEEDNLDKKEREDLFDWWREFGFRGRDGGMGRVLSSEPKRPKKGKKGHKRGDEERRKRKASSKTPSVVAELEGDCFATGSVPIISVPIISEPDKGLFAGPEPTDKEPRPFSFLPGQEEIVPLTQANESSQSLPSRFPSSDNDSLSVPSRDFNRLKLTPLTIGDSEAGAEQGYDSEGSLPDSPMEEISEEVLREGRHVLMGFNLNNDLPNFLRWESERSVRWEYGGRGPLYEMGNGGVERSMSY